MRSLLKRSILLVVLCAPMTGQSVARAQGAAPPCGPAFTDPAGDQIINAEPRRRGPSNTDVVAGAFAPGGDAVTASIRIADLSRTVPDGTTGVGYYMIWRVDTLTRYVRAELDAAGRVEYAYGHFDAMAGVFVDDGPTTGTFATGADGVISLEIPAVAAPAGTMLEDPHAVIYDRYMPEIGTDDRIADVAPDDFSGVDYRVGGPCATEATSATTPKACTSRRAFTVTLRVRSATIRRLRVTLDGRRLEVARGGRRPTVRVDLRDTGRKRVVLRALIRTTSGRLLRDTRAYNPCARRAGTS